MCIEVYMFLLLERNHMCLCHSMSVYIYIYIYMHIDIWYMIYDIWYMIYDIWIILQVYNIDALYCIVLHCIALHYITYLFSHFMLLYMLLFWCGLVWDENRLLYPKIPKFHGLSGFLISIAILRISHFSANPYANGYTFFRVWEWVQGKHCRKPSYLVGSKQVSL